MSSPEHSRRPEGGHRGWWVVAGLSTVAVALAASGTIVYLRTRGTSPARAAASPKPAVTPLAVLGTSPSAKATGVASDATVTVDLTTPLAARSPMPTFTPPVAGHWSSASPDMLQYVADGPLVPGTRETLTIPGGTGGLLAGDGRRLSSTVSVPFTVAPGSTLRLQQLLAQLGYLPVSFVPATQATSPQQEAEPQAGTFAWRWPTMEMALATQWTPGTFGVVTKGAVMAFQTQHGLTTTGIPGPGTWSTLLQAAAAGQGDTASYDYVAVSRTLPENVTVYQNGSSVYNTLANTGVPAAPTDTGTFAVFEHVQSTTMSGTNPTGSHYTDPDIPWVSYFNGGDALHGYVRASYGFPQSDGCVEMPPANAAVVWPYTPIGTLVTVA
jgi:L,D-transpeptidase catalytic domain/Putative peptidoglycan binding domain